MAIKEFLPVRFESVFPFGAYLNSEVMPVSSYEDGKKMGQAIDPETGERLWSVTVIDGDESLKSGEKAVTVKLIAPHQPVPPEKVAGQPFTPVEFTDMVVRAYVAESGFGGGRGRLMWSIKARGIIAAGAGDL